jgi:hypothetical protein
MRMAITTSSSTNINPSRHAAVSMLCSDIKNQPAHTEYDLKSAFIRRFMKMIIHSTQDAL